MSSDEDLPLTALAGTSGKSYVAVNGNAHSNGGPDDSPMSEDDMPLVCVRSVHYMLCSPCNFPLVPGKWCPDAK